MNGGTVHRRLIPEQPIPGQRLGRHVRHDPRSRAYPVDPTGVVQSVAHTRRVDVYDQGDLGDCVANALAGTISTDPFTHRYRSQRRIRGIYRHLTAEDDIPGQWPPDDTGSDGLSAARYALERGWCTEYRHAFSLRAALVALQTTPVLVGITWLTGCDTPDDSGLVRYTGTVRGGHEIVATGVDVESQLVWFVNSWGDWGPLAGYFCMTWADFDTALADDGDVTQLVP